MNFDNRLAIMLITTLDEYKSGDVGKAILRYFHYNKSSVDKKIDIRIYFNKCDASAFSELQKLKQLENIHEIYIYALNLTEIEDVYFKSLDDFLQQVPEYERPKYELGATSGPNNLFYRSIGHILQYNYRDILLLETDSQPMKELWLDKLIHYCDNNSFLIAGSVYKGTHCLDQYAVWSGHLNGIAIYRNIPFLKVFIEESKKLIKKYVVRGENYYLSFDVAMHLLYSCYFGRTHCQDRRYPENHLIDVPIISNLSLPCDANISLDKINKQYPDTIILHKK